MGFYTNRTIIRVESISTPRIISIFSNSFDAPSEVKSLLKGVDRQSSIGTPTCLGRTALPL